MRCVKKLNIIMLMLLLTFCSKSYVKDKHHNVYKYEKESYMKAHPNLPEKDKICIQEKRFEIGMFYKTVQFLVGEPIKIDTIEQNNNKVVKWLYRHRILKKEYGIKGFIFNTEGNLINIIKYK